jgi:hypothetical protein
MGCVVILLIILLCVALPVIILMMSEAGFLYSSPEQKLPREIAPRRNFRTERAYDDNEKSGDAPEPYSDINEKVSAPVIPMTPYNDSNKEKTFKDDSTAVGGEENWSGEKWDHFDDDSYFRAFGMNSSSDDGDDITYAVDDDLVVKAVSDRSFIQRYAAARNPNNKRK